MKPRKYSRFVSGVTALSMLFSASAGVLLSESTKAQSRQTINSTDRGNASALARYTRELTLLARQGRLDITNDHDAEIRRVIQILSDSRQNSPVLTGESDLDSVAVVEGLAARIASDDVPESLRQTRLYSLNLNALFSGVKTPADIEGRVKAVLADVAGDKNSI